MRAKEEYYSELRKLETGKSALPSLLQSIVDDAAYSRINRASLTQGFITVWWDNRDIQIHLAEAFTPTAVKRHSAIKYPDTYMGEVLARLGRSFDERGLYVYPEISEAETTIQAVVNLHCVLAKEDKYTGLVRALTRSERKHLLALNNLPKKATMLKINTGLDSLPH